METTKSKEAEVEVDALHEREFDEAIEQASSKIDEMAARALKARAEGRTLPFPQ